MKYLALIGAVAGCVLSHGPALAQDSSPTIFGRNLAVTVKARVAPDYMGSDDYSVGPAGSISLSLPGDNSGWGAPDDGLSLALLGDDTLSVGLTGRLRWSRDNDDDLRGFDKIDWAVEGGAYVNWWLTDSLRARAEARRGFGGHEGWVVDLGADLVSKGERLTVSIGPRLRWVDDEYAQTYFGVTPLEAARSPFAIAAYSAEGGAASAGVIAGAEYHWSDSWSVVGDAEWRRLLGDAADSPIVAQLGSEDQFSASLGVKYVFGR